MNFTVTTTIADKNLFHIFIQRHGPANIYLFKVSNRNTRKSYEMFSKLTIKKPERRQQLVFLLLTFSLTPFSRVSFADFEQVNVSRGLSKTRLDRLSKIKDKFIGNGKGDLLVSVSMYLC